MKHLIFSSACILLLGCSVIDGDFHEKNIELAKIQGEWEATRISVIYLGQIYPDTSGTGVLSNVNDITISVTNDEAKWFVDGKLSIVHTIKYDKELEGKLILEMKSRPLDQFNVVSKDFLTNGFTDSTFVLFDNCSHCFTYYFSRK